MTTTGSFTWFNRGLLKIGGNGPVNMLTHDIRAVLSTSAQVISPTFVGASGDCRYSDLTNELATANGYTNGGVSLTTLTEARYGAGNDHVKWYADTIQWVLSNPITFKYLSLVDWTAANKDLIAFMDFDIGGGSVTPVAGTIFVIPDATSGFLYRYREP